MERLRTKAGLTLVVTLLGVCACDPDEKTSTVVHQQPLPEIGPYGTPKAVSLAEAPTHKILLTEPKRVGACHTLFEPKGQVVSKLPWAHELVFESLLSCGAEAWLERADGQGRYVVYGVPIGDGKKNQRIASFDQDGAYRWSAKVDRSQQGNNFVANYRDAFVTEIGTRHVCVGTMWEGGTQATCLDPKSGKINWNGRMSFWAGMKPMGGEEAFHVADLSSITQRYPFSGVEMRHRKLDGTGGRAALYAASAKNLYFSPARAEESRLVKYDLATLNPKWRTALPHNTSAGFGKAFEEHQVVLIKVDKDLVAIDTESGAALWKMNVGEDRPSVASRKDELVILHRVPDVPNLVFGIHPKTGKIRWQAVAPVGVLNVHSDGNLLILMGIRATQVASQIEAL